MMTVLLASLLVVTDVGVLQLTILAAAAAAAHDDDDDDIGA